MKTKNSNGAFTLIELLVVISIISLLASVVLTNLSTAREKARLTANIQFEANVLHGIGDQLVGEWKFDEGAGSAKDTSSFGNNGVVTAAVYDATGGYNGRGTYTFDGSDKYINIGTPSVLNFQGLTSFTEAAWINLAAAGCGNCTIIGRHTGLGNVMGTLRVGGGKLQFLVETPSGLFQTTSDGPVPANKWVYVAAVYDGTNVLYYMNGALDSKKPLTGAVTASMASIVIGRNSAGGENFIGKIDTVRMYTRALTAMNIQDMYAQEKSRYEDSVALK